jgi:hypothetical protein
VRGPLEGRSTSVEVFFLEECSMRLTLKRSLFARWLVALFGSSAVWGCGGAVDLGGSPDSGTAVDGGTSPGVTTVYEGSDEYFLGFAVDESMLYFSSARRGEPYFYVQACDLEACAATVRTIYRTRPNPDLGHPLDFESSQLAVANGEIFFASMDELNTPYIMACPTTGCGDAPRKLTRIGAYQHLVATEMDVYWSTWGTVFRCAREGCGAPVARTLGSLMGSAGAGAFDSMVVAGDFVYAIGSYALGRAKRDLSAEPDWVYTSDLPIRGVAVAGNWVYFAMATYDGEVRRCPLTGCGSDPEVVASGQPRPTSTVADERAVHWLNYALDQQTTIRGSVAAVTLDGQSSVRTIATDLKLRPEMRIRMNSHHVYWAESDFVPSTISWIRSVAK